MPSKQVTRRRTRERLPASVPNDLRRHIDAWADAWLKTKFSRGLQWRAADPGPFNHPIAVFSEWTNHPFICSHMWLQ